MALKSVSAELIGRQASELLERDYSEGRLGELAAELDALNRPLHEHAPTLEFEDEPLRFAALMARLASEAREP